MAVDADKLARHRAAALKYQKSHREIVNVRQARWRRLNPESRKRSQALTNAKRLKSPEKRARDMVNCKVQRGQLPRVKTLLCCVCGNHAEHYHHFKGYEREYWYEVLPLCAKCHLEYHK